MYTHRYFLQLGRGNILLKATEAVKVHRSSIRFSFFISRLSFRAGFYTLTLQGSAPHVIVAIAPLSNNSLSISTLKILISYVLSTAANLMSSSFIIFFTSPYRFQSHLSSHSFNQNFTTSQLYEFHHSSQLILRVLHPPIPSNTFYSFLIYSPMLSPVNPSSTRTNRTSC